jgi:hypothetical protein
MPFGYLMANPNKASSHGHHFLLQDCKDPRRSDLTDRPLPAHIMVSSDGVRGLFTPSLSFIHFSMFPPDL